MGKTVPGGVVTFTHKATGRILTAQGDAEFGTYKIELPSGEYDGCCGDKHASLTFISGKTYKLPEEFVFFSGQTQKKDEVVILSLKSCGKIKLYGYNLKDLPKQVMVEGEVGVTAQIMDPNEPVIVIAEVMNTDAARQEWIL